MLTFIFNETQRNGIVPGKLKTAVVQPIHKKESSIIWGNYQTTYINSSYY